MCHRRLWWPGSCQCFWIPSGSVASLQCLWLPLGWWRYHDSQDCGQEEQIERSLIHWLVCGLANHLEYNVYQTCKKEHLSDRIFGSTAFSDLLWTGSRSWYFLACGSISSTNATFIKFLFGVDDAITTSFYTLALHADRGGVGAAWSTIYHLRKEEQVSGVTH